MTLLLPRRPEQAALITAIEFYLLGLVDGRFLLFGSAFPDQASIRSFHDGKIPGRMIW